MERRIGTATTLLACMALGTAGVLPAAADARPHDGPLGKVKHLVVIYEENHSFDNLYGNWGTVSGEPVIGRAMATPSTTTQVDASGAPYQCLLMSDLNLMSPPLSPDCSTTTFSYGAGKPSTAYHFANQPFNIDNFIPATATTCPIPSQLFTHPFGVLDGQGVTGGCTRDLVHRFYQEQYQLNGGRQNRYVTGSDSAGMTMGYYDTTKLPIYQYLHSRKAPNYVVLDQFFQAAFGGSFLNHQYLVAATAPPFAGGTHSVLDTNGFPKGGYPLYHSAITPTDGADTQACGLTTTVVGYACGDYAVNTVQPPYQPTNAFGAKMPLVDDTSTDLTIGDRLTDAHVSWAWFSGGWDNASGNVGGKGWTNGTGTACSDPNASPASPDLAGHGGFPYCPDFSFQTHHQPFNYYARYAPGQSDRSHLQDEQNFIEAAKHGRLPAVSFVKPLGNENEHPGYASEPKGSDHLVDLISAIEHGPNAKDTLIVVTYDEFGGQWDHVSPPGMGTVGPHDLFGPGTRIPALVIGGDIHRSGVDHTVYDTTSIMRTIEAQWNLAPVASRDAVVNDLGNAVDGGGHGHEPGD